MQQCQVWPISDQKVRQNTGILYILTYKCAARHSGVQFFDIGTLKSCPRPSVFYDFDFKMCFLPQRAIFAHLNFKKCSEPLSFLAFSLQNVLLATTAYNFSTSQLKKVVRTRATGGWARPLRLKVPLKVPLKGTLRSIEVLVSPPPPPLRRSEALRVPLRYPLRYPLRSPLRYPLRSPLRYPLRSPLRYPLRYPLRSPLKVPLKGTLKVPLQGTLQGYP